MPRESKLKAIQAWNHFLANEFKFGGIERVQKIVNYYDRSKENISTFETEHKAFVEYCEEKMEVDSDA